MLGNPPPRPAADTLPPFLSVAAPRSFKLRELEAVFERAEPYEGTWERVKPEVFNDPARQPPFKPEDFEKVTGMRYLIKPVDTLAEAQGIFFLCPLCFHNNRDNAHLVSVGFAGRAPPGTFSRDSDGKDSRWQIVGGTGLDDLQLSPSIWLKSRGGCGWHGFVGHAGVPAGEAR